MTQVSPQIQNALAILVALDKTTLLKKVLFTPLVVHHTRRFLSLGGEEVSIICKAADIDDFKSSLEKFNVTQGVNYITIQDDGEYCIVDLISQAISETSNKTKNVLITDGKTAFTDITAFIRGYESHLHNNSDVTIFKSAEDYLSNIWVKKSSYLEIKTDFACKEWDEQAINKISEVMEKSSLKHGYFDVTSIAIYLNTPKDMFILNTILKDEIIHHHLDNGVEFITLDGIVIGPEVEIGKGTTIYPSTLLRGDTIIGENCTIGPNSLIADTIIGNNTTLNATQSYSSTIGNDVSIGPFCHIRPNSVIKDKVKLGDFVEVKNSTLDEEVHVSHLTYVGDSDVGKRVNFGCGVVTVNYNGKTKARCTIKDDAFIGCNTNLIAPVTVEEKGYTAAGSTISKDVPANALAVERSKQVNYNNWNK